LIPGSSRFEPAQSLSGSTIAELSFADSPETAVLVLAVGNA
jgi:hypothetical protein